MNLGGKVKIRMSIEKVEYDEKGNVISKVVKLDEKTKESNENN